MKRILILLTFILFFSICGGLVVKANEDLSGYVYSDGSGWISLNCSNTNSCDSISYKVSRDNNRLVGYGYSQSSGWVNFNPNYGGVGINSASLLSGWIFSEKSGWISLNEEAIFSGNDLEKKVESAKNIVGQYKDFSIDNLAETNLSGLLNSLCLQFFNSSQCAS